MKSENQTIEELKGELGKYKENVLCVTEQGTYNYKGKSKSYSHILPKEEADKNIIDSALKLDFNNVKKHALFNHLNSSQALCLNLFGPLVADRLDLLNPLLGFDVKDCVNSQFEFVDDLIHDSSNFDFFIETKKHERLYFEIKYTESSIHTTCRAKDADARYRRLYSKPMEIILKNKNCIPMNVFCKQYQLWRNICHVAYDHCDVFFVFPEFREKLKVQVEEAKKLLKPEYQNRVHILTVDVICNTILNSAGEKYKAHYQEFKNKYFPSSVFGENNK